MGYTIRISEEQYKKLFKLKQIYQKDVSSLLRKTIYFFIKNPEAFKDLEFFLLKNLKIKKGLKSNFICSDKKLLLKAFSLFQQVLQNDVFLLDEIKILSKTPFLSEKLNKALPFFVRLIIDYLIENHEKILKEKML